MSTAPAAAAHSNKVETLKKDVSKLEQERAAQARLFAVAAEKKRKQDAERAAIAAAAEEQRKRDSQIVNVPPPAASAAPANGAYDVPSVSDLPAGDSVAVSNAAPDLGDLQTQVRYLHVTRRHRLTTLTLGVPLLSCLILSLPRPICPLPTEQELLDRCLKLFQSRLHRAI